MTSLARVWRLLEAHPPDEMEPPGDARALGGARWRGGGPTPLPLEIREQPEGVVVGIGPWSHRILGLDDDAWAETADLIAGGLFGWIRAAMDQHRGRWVRCRVEVLVDGMWTRSAELRRFRWPPWARTDPVVLRNDFAAPAWAVRSSKRVVLPGKPWAGLLQEEAAAWAGELALDGELDLHPFRPKDVAPLVREYIVACRERGVLSLRLVHGKGIGNLRRTVHAVLEKHAAVRSFRLGGSGEGGWGATLVELLPPNRGDPETS